MGVTGRSGRRAKVGSQVGSGRRVKVGVTGGIRLKSKDGGHRSEHIEEQRWGSQVGSGRRAKMGVTGRIR